MFYPLCLQLWLANSLCSKKILVCITIKSLNQNMGSVVETTKNVGLFPKL